VKEHSPLPWRSVYPLGSKQRCAAVEAGDHYVYLHVFQPDDTMETIHMHQANADLIVAAVNGSVPQMGPSASDAKAQETINPV
jgi:hypothetical protein